MSGDEFTQPALFTTIYIPQAGVMTPFTISSVTSLTALVISSSAGVLSGVAALIPVGISNSIIEQIGAMQNGDLHQVRLPSGSIPFRIDQLGNTWLTRAATSQSFSATPVWTLGNGDFGMTLTGNVTSMTTTGTPQLNQTYITRFCQDGTGSRTVVPATNILGFTAPTSTAGVCTSQWFRSVDGVNLEAIAPGAHN